MKLSLNSTVLKGSLLLLIAFNVYNALNFIFQALMARMLGLADFSIYGPLSALIYLLAVVTDSSQTVITKYTSGKVDDGKVKNILKRALRKSFFAALILFLAYSFISIPLAQVLRVPFSLMILTGSLIFTSFLIPIGRGALQGKKRFFALGLNTISEAFIKIGLGVFFVFIGWKVYGVITAIALSVFLSFVLSLLPLKKILSSKEETAEMPNLYSYSLPAFVVLFSISSFYVIDLLMARALFPDETAGLYAVLALLGKALFWGTQPISKALFPISAESKSEHRQNDLATALMILGVCLLIALILFWMVPDFLIYLLSGVKGPIESNILLIVGLSFSIISASNLILLYKLSLGRTKGFFFLLLPLLVEIGLLYYFGIGKTLVDFSYGLFLSSILYFFVSLVALKK
jgi:O-antigen/teichoic acid export membrane protein